MSKTFQSIRTGPAPESKIITHDLECLKVKVYTKDIRTGNTPIGKFGFNQDALGPWLSYQSPNFMNWGSVNAGLIGNLGQNRGFLGIRGDW